MTKSANALALEALKIMLNLHANRGYNPITEGPEWCKRKNEIEAAIAEFQSKPPETVKLAKQVSEHMYVQPVPDYCTGITWRDHYHRLPIAAPQPSDKAAEPSTIRDFADRVISKIQSEIDETLKNYSSASNRLAIDSLWRIDSLIRALVGANQQAGDKAAECGGDPTEEYREEFLSLAKQCGACITGKPDGSEKIEVVFSIAAWRKFDLATQPVKSPITDKAEPKEPLSMSMFANRADYDAQDMCQRFYAWINTQADKNGYIEGYDFMERAWQEATRQAQEGK